MTFFRDAFPPSGDFARFPLSIKQGLVHHMSCGQNLGGCNDFFVAILDGRRVSRVGAPWFFLAERWKR